MHSIRIYGWFLHLKAKPAWMMIVCSWKVHPYQWTGLNKAINWKSHVFIHCLWCTTNFLRLECLFSSFSVYIQLSNLIFDLFTILPCNDCESFGQYRKYRDEKKHSINENSFSFTSASTYDSSPQKLGRLLNYSIASRLNDGNLNLHRNLICCRFAHCKYAALISFVRDLWTIFHAFRSTKLENSQWNEMNQIKDHWPEKNIHSFFNFSRHSFLHHNS